VWLPGGFEPYFRQVTEAMGREEGLDPADVVRLSAEYDVFFASE
jgi:hypothetical protein